MEIKALHKIFTANLAHQTHRLWNFCLSISVFKITNFNKTPIYDRNKRNYNILYICYKVFQNSDSQFDKDKFVE